MNKHMQSAKTLPSPHRLTAFPAVVNSGHICIHCRRTGYSPTNVRRIFETLAH